jgi:integrative and conjugative element protein (TIGR02256 family)
MDEDWQLLSEGGALSGSEELQLPRARGIADAIARHSDYTLVRCSRIEGERVLEVLVVDVECNAVPPNNPMGIEFRERLALMVPDARSEAIEVVGLRKGFPRLMHQNARPPRWPPSLCLYFEPQRAVMRTWTPENFLQRIQIWLEKTSRGELHPADQPVEQMFFVTSHELVLPWNIDALMQQVPPPVFEILAGPVRAGKEHTYFLRQRQTDSADSPSIALVQLTLPPVVHGRIEPDPATLGGLDDMLKSRGVGLLQALKDAISERVSEGGVPVQSDAKATIILLHMPITRAEGQPPERIARRGYALTEGVLKLGTLTGSLFTHEKKYFKESTADFLSRPEQVAWKDAAIESIEVIRGLSPQTARQQSGLTDAGPRGAVVGAGALGATLLDLWVRSGWGQWSVVDQDHIKPHNLVRHPADQRHLGLPKEQVAVFRHDEIMNGASTMTAVHADACVLVEGKPLPSIHSAELVVDASTTLDYPRLMSGRDDVGRHASMFLTPKANAGVILLEDAGRSTRLRSLEAQYYRAVIEHPWGADHLAGNQGTFWSGAGCRDISVVMPYSAVMAHSALLAEQLQALVSKPDASIRVWTRDGDGAVAMHAVPVRPERAIRFDDMYLFIDEAVVDKMHRLRESHLPNETGGVLLGYYDLNINAIVVVDALEAPPDSQSTPGFFERGVQGVAEAAKEAHRRTAGIVGYIGEWHSHPPGHSAKPSGDDFYQLAYLALGMSHDGLAAMSLIVGAGGELQALKCSVRS